jgi:hypothetical protein
MRLDPTNLRSAGLKHQLVIPTAALGKIPVKRSWISLDARVNRASLHFVDTHLEAYSAGVRLDQANDLVAGPLWSSRQTILVGDTAGTTS